MAARKAKRSEPSKTTGRSRSELSRKQRIGKLLRAFEKRLDIDNSKVTLGDYIRLMQLERELEDEEQPREIIVTWKDPAEKRCESK
jgi:hypothetical protein